MNNIQFSIAALLVASSTLIQAADEAITPIVITATRTAQSADESLAAVTVITQEDIQNSQANNLTELLSGSVGMDVTETGWYGQSSNYYIRGTSSKHILVLVDGVQLGSATTGSTDLVEIGLDHIERIEIVRGPRSSLYGSSAIGGVIHIFTRQGVVKEQAHIKLGYGSYNTRTLAAGISGGNDKTQVQLALSRLSTDGTNISENNNPDDDGYEVDRVSASLQHKLSERSSIDIAAYQNKSTTEYDGYTATSAYTKETTQQSLSAGVNLAPLNEWELQLRASKSRDESDNYKDDVLSGIFHTQRNQFTWQNDITLSDSALLTLGVDRTIETIESQTTYTETERTVSGGFTELQKSYTNQDIFASLRSDDFGSLGRHTTGNLDWGYSLSDTLRLTAGYGTAFKAPTFNDLYYPVQPWGEGNPDLKPENSVSYEVGMRGKHTIGNWSVSAFHTEISDLIEWQCIANCALAPTWDDVYKPFNVSSAQIDGIEASIEHQRDNRDMKLSLTLLDARDEESGNKLQNRADASLRLDLDQQSGSWRNGVTLLAQSARYADSANTRELDAYATVDLRTHYALDKHWYIKGKVRNLFDKEYLTTDTSYQPSGRTYLLSLSYNMGQSE
ncbi:MAG: TonB-dependent receptor [Pseudomonadota bacterium]